MKNITREQYAEIAQRMAQQPMPKLTRTTAAVFADGERVRYRGAFWYVFGTPRADSIWVRLWDGVKDGCIQCAPADLVTPAPKAKVKVRTVHPTPRPKKAPIIDDVTYLMREAVTLDDLWAIAASRIPDHEALRARVGHLNPGLQRMNIGNHLRRLITRGLITLTPVEVVDVAHPASHKKAKKVNAAGRGRDAHGARDGAQPAD